MKELINKLEILLNDLKNIKDDKNDNEVKDNDNEVKDNDNEVKDNNVVKDNNNEVKYDNNEVKDNDNDEKIKDSNKCPLNKETKEEVLKSVKNCPFFSEGCPFKNSHKQILYDTSNEYGCIQNTDIQTFNILEFLLGFLIFFVITLNLIRFFKNIHDVFNII